MQTYFRNAAVTQHGPAEHAACLLHNEIAVWPEVPSGQDVPRFPSMSIRTAEPPIPCGSSHPSSARPRSPGSIAPDRARLLNHGPVVSAPDHRSKGDAVLSLVVGAVFLKHG